jgi:hypothetical protein
VAEAFPRRSQATAVDVVSRVGIAPERRSRRLKPECLRITRTPDCLGVFFVSASTIVGGQMDLGTITRPPRTARPVLLVAGPRNHFFFILSNESPVLVQMSQLSTLCQNGCGTCGRVSMRVTRISAAAGVIVHRIWRIRHKPSFATISHSDPVRAATRLVLGARARDRQREGCGR